MTTTLPSDHPLRDLATWDATPHDQQRALIDALDLPPSIHHTGWLTPDAPQRQIATFSYDHQRFALIPGSYTLLGEDAHEVARRMSEAQRESYDYSRRMFRNLPSLRAYLESILSPLRYVELPPALIEIDARPLHDWEDTHAEDAALGFELPSLDLWEYACRSGSRTLWRWGDEVPLDAYPTNRDRFDLHLRPNAFGLNMTSSAWSWESCADDRLIVGGNGGTTIFEGAGYLLAWLPLASSFFEIRNAEADTSFTSARRILRLG
jgi:hypothetical protein